MGVRVGIDLVAVASIEDILSGPLSSRYLDRVFTLGELADCNDAGSLRPERLAARFAVKEAVVKVLPGSTILLGRSIALGKDTEGRETVVLTGPAAVLAAGARIEGLRVSTSCRGGYVAAIVVAEISEQGAGDQDSHLATQGGSIPGPEPAV